VSSTEIRSIVVVCPWYGPQTAGGAEVHARRLAESLREAGVNISVFSSTARDCFSPEALDYYPAGPQEVNGVPVVRFPSRRDNGASWRQAHADLLGGQHFPEEEQHLIAQLIADDSLYNEIARRRDDALFLFMPYIWGTTFWGAMLARDRAVLIPCLHDELYAQYRVYRHLFHRVRGVLFNSLPEMEVAVQRFDFPRVRGHVVGEGVDSPGPGDPERFHRRFGVGGPFILYIGRRDHGKGVPMLIEFFCAYKDRHPGPLKLVLGGKNPVFPPLPFADQVVDLGYIAEQDKHDAYAAAAVVCQPSLYESFSLVLMESWLQGTPVLVNARCAVTVHHCRASNGGLYFQDYAEFEACLDYLLQRPAVRRQMGQRGRDYVLENFTWPAVVQRMMAALQEMGIHVPFSRPQD
jgi:glycosyltransferase involved in cell wall biosynthesis